jgi:hypothetical protein
MATDAKFDRIQKIVPHDNADSLEIAIVSNFPCVVRKGEFKAGDIVFYIRDDAKLIDVEEYLAWSKEMKKPDVMGQMEFQWNFPWQESLVKYVGSGARVKTIKLRGKVSMGILLKMEDACSGYSCKFYVGNDNFDEINAKILDPETGDKFLKDNFGVGHWTAPVGNIGNLDVLHQGLDFGLEKSDEENWENLPEEDLHLGEKCLVTKKLDGTSCTVICQPNGEYSVASRSQTFNVKRMAENNEENIYTKFAYKAIKAGLWYAKTFNTVIAFRGEVCCGAVQNFGINRDRERNGFFVYGCEFPYEENWFLKHGIYGTVNHFLKIVETCKNAGYDVDTVPILNDGKEMVVSKELLKSFNDAPASFGEGVVLNIKCEDQGQELKSFVWHYKSKSREYLQKIK